MLDVLELLDQAIPDETEAESKEEVTDEFNRSNAWTHDKSGNNTDAELEDMQRDVDLISLIRQDTGESGSGSGDTIYFKSCPICGHKDCFRFHPSTNMWECWGGSNPNKNAKNGSVEVGAFLRYVLRTGKAQDNTEAVKMLREATGNEYQPNRQKPISEHAEQRGETEDEVEFVPECLDGNELLALADDDPDWLLRGVYARGDVDLITGLSGLGKTHLAMELCLAHATGGEVLGHRAERARVLAIDPEMRSAGLARRMRGVSSHYNATADENKNLMYVCTRVAPKNLSQIDKFIGKLDSEHRPDVLILDSISVITALDGLDENSNPDVTKFLIRVKRLARRHDCAIVLMHHPPKNAGMAFANSGTLIRGAEAWRAGADNVFELIPLKVEEDTGAWELQKAYRWQGVDEHGDTVTRYPSAVRLQCTKFRYDAKPRPIDMLFRPPIHIVDGTGELKECAIAIERPSDKGGATTKKNAEQKRKTEEDALADIVYDLESEGTVPDSETVVKRLNQWRKENGISRSICAETLERYTTEGKKRKYFSVLCVDGIFECVAEPEAEPEGSYGWDDETETLDDLDGTRLAMSNAG